MGNKPITLAELGNKSQDTAFNAKYYRFSELVLSETYLVWISEPLPNGWPAHIELHVRYTHDTDDGTKHFQISNKSDKFFTQLCKESYQNETTIAINEAFVLEKDVIFVRMRAEERFYKVPSA